jgi:hypothetical protein
MTVFGLTMRVGTAILRRMNALLNAKQNWWWLPEQERAAD